MKNSTDVSIIKLGTTFKRKLFSNRVKNIAALDENCEESAFKDLAEAIGTVGDYLNVGDSETAAINVIGKNGKHCGYAYMKIEKNDKDHRNLFMFHTNTPCNIKDLPRAKYGTINIHDSKTVFGNVKDLPEVDKVLDITYTKISGNVKDLPKISSVLNISGNKELVGNISDLPKVKSSLNINSCKELKGECKDLPKVEHSLSMSGCSNISGNIKDLPRVKDVITIDGCTSLIGAIEDLPNVITEVSIADTNIVGDIKDLPNVSHNLDISKCIGIYGDIKDLPRVTNGLNLAECSQLTGNIKDLPNVECFINLDNCEKITGDLSVMNEISNSFSIVNCKGLHGVPKLSSRITDINVCGSGMTSNDLDTMLINLSEIVEEFDGIIEMDAIRTSSSLNAIGILNALDWEIIEHKVK